MKNSENLFYHAKKYQDERKAIMDVYEKRIAALEDARGSKLYEKETAKAADERDKAISALKAEYQGGFDSILKEMQAVSDTRATTPPTEEELRIVQALKLKDTVTEGELQRAAYAVKNNGLCLSVIQDIARKNGSLRNYLSLCTEKKLPADSVTDCVKNLKAGIRDFMDYDTARAARIARESHERIYGKIDETKPAEKTVGGWSSGWTPVPKRKLFDTKEGFYSVVANMGGEELTAFCAAVDD